MPYCVELFHEIDGYWMRFARLDVGTGHGVCHLDVAADWPICQRAADQGPVLKTVPWMFLVGYDPEEQTATLKALAENVFEDAPPPRVLAGWVAKHVPVAFALAIVDGFCRSGNLMIHNQMTDRHGDKVDWAVPIHKTHFKVKDDTGHLQERIMCDWRGRN